VTYILKNVFAQDSKFYAKVKQISFLTPQRQDGQGDITPSLFLLFIIFLLRKKKKQTKLFTFSKRRKL